MDKDLLMYEMKKREISVDSLCDKLGISRSAFYRKMNGSSEFTLGEVRGIIQCLGLTNYIDIFFVK